MSLVQRAWRAWREDRLLHGILRNSGYLFSANTISTLLGSLQGFLSALLLGPAGYGTLGMVVLFASAVNRLLSFRMGEVVVRYAGQALAQGRREQAASVIKAAALAEALTSVTAYLLLLLLAPLAAQVIFKDASVTPWIAFYGLALLANLVTETSTAVLQIGSHFRSQALLNLAQGALTAGWVAVAYFAGGGVQDVLAAYLAGKLVFGVGVAALALRALPALLGADWKRASLRRMEERGAMLRFALSSNLSATLNLVLRDSEVLWVGYFLTSLEAGYYKFALAAMGVVSLPVTPLVATTYPAINRAIAEQKWQTLRDLLRRTAILGGGFSLACAAGLALLAPWFYRVFKNGAYLPGLPLVFVLMAGYGVANALFWNRPLLLAQGDAHYPLKVTALVGLVKVALMFLLVPQYGSLAQAGLLSLYFIVSIGWITRKGLRAIPAGRLGG